MIKLEYMALTCASVNLLVPGATGVATCGSQIACQMTKPTWSQIVLILIFASATPVKGENDLLIGNEWNCGYGL